MNTINVISKPEVAIIVLNHNGIQFLETCFNSLLRTTYPAIELWMYDNCSTEEDVNFVKSKYPCVKVIESKINGGYSLAYNEAIKQVNTKYAVLLNNDVEVEPDWIDHLVAAAQADDSIAALQPKLISLTNRKQFEYAGSSGGEMDKYGYPFLRGRVFFTIENDTGQYEDVKEIFWASGAALFVKTSSFIECGGLDETFVHHMEEIDLCWRLLLLGYKIKVIPKSVVAHYGGGTIKSDSYKKMHWNHRNSVFMLMKNLGQKKLIKTLFIRVILDLITALVFLVSFKPRRSRAIFNAYIWIFSNLTIIKKKRREVQLIRRVDDKKVFKKIYPKSIAIQYFLFKKKTYTDLIKSIN